MKKILYLLVFLLVFFAVVFYFAQQKEQPAQSSSAPETTVKETSQQEQGPIDIAHFFYACQKGDIPIVERFEQEGGDLNQGDENGYTCLMMASYNDQVDLVQWLVNHGANMNAQSKRGKTAVMLAAQGNALTAFEFLLRAGADLNYKDNRGRTVATLVRDNTLAFLEDWEQEHPSARTGVATSGQKTIPSVTQQQRVPTSATGTQQGMSASEKLLLEVCSFKPNKSTLDPIVELIKMRADVNFEGQCDPSDMMTYTPLGRAIEQNLIKVAQVLLEKGADPSKRYGISDLSPLMHAAFENRPQIADMLVYYGANVNECDSSLHSALDYAKYKSPEVAKVLRSHNAKENACELLTTEQIKGR